jgi:5-formyltetrahydrofolate cyclo-ligase
MRANASTPARERAALRRALRARRRSVPPREHQRLSSKLCRKLLSWPGFLHARRFACFLSNDGEPDLDALVQRAASMGKRAYLPVLHERRLWFLAYTNATPMVSNRYGILEPSAASAVRTPLAALDIALVPLVAFDDHGHRLGMGGGYYDRTFAYLRHRKHWRRPKLIGVAFEFQRLAELPAQPWDVPLDGIITEKGLLSPG